MTSKRRRTVHSLWMDAVRREKAAKKLRRSVQRNPRIIESSQTSDSTPKIQGVRHPHTSSHQDVPDLGHHNTEVEIPTIPVNIDSVPPATSTREHVQHIQQDKSLNQECEKGSLSSGDYNRTEREHDYPDLDRIAEQNDMQDDNGLETDTQREPPFQPFEPYEGILPNHTSNLITTPPSHFDGLCSEPIVTNESTYERDGTNNQQQTRSSPSVACDGDDEGEYSGIPDVNSKDMPIGRLFRVWKSVLNLNALIAVVGSVRFTVNEYNYARDSIRDAGANPTWPPYARTRTYFQQIIETCMPRSEILRVAKTNVQTRKVASNDGDNFEEESGYPDLDFPIDGSTAQARAVGEEILRVFLPSSWAKLDVATAMVFDQMFPSFDKDHRVSTALDSSPIIRDRASITRCCDSIFVKSGSEGQHVRCGPGSRIAVLVQNEAPDIQSNYEIRETTGAYVLNTSVVACWAVGSSDHDTCTVEDVLRKQSLTPSNRAIISALSKAAHPDPNDEGDILGVLPGDICTLLRSEQGETDTFAVLVHRYWRCDEGLPSVTIIWVHVPLDQTETTSDERDQIEYLYIHVVEQLNLLHSSYGAQNGQVPDQEPASRAEAKSHGILDDGTPFLIYRILLYCDDFQKSSAMYPKGSAGGCYFMPMSLPPEARRNKSSVRVISLTPPGVSTNQVLHYIVEDLVNASVYGVDGHTPTGRKVKIFIDVLGFVGDYPASASVVDVVGHVSSSPCTVCSFRRSRQEGTQGARFGYTTDVHANNSAFMRCGERHTALRKSEVSDDTARLLGMVSHRKYSDKNCPLLYLQRTLESRRNRSVLTIDGVAVVSNLFDAFRCNLIAPDHLLTGLAKDALNAMCRALPTDTLRLKADALICTALRDNGLLPQNQVFNHAKKKIHSMTLSELFCVLLVSVPTLKEVVSDCTAEDISQECFQLVSSLQSLVALTYWWPLRELDGEEAVNLVHHRKEVYISDLRCMSKRYVFNVHNICKKSEVLRKELDKPNLHRLIELYEHTVPAFGHVREVMELVFESAHQPLKRCIARSNNHNSHIFAVEHSVANDWQGRLAALTRRMTHSDENIRTSARRGIRRVLLGPQADLFDEERDKNLLFEIDPILHKLFTPAVRKQFDKNNMISNLSAEKRSVWKARSMMEIKEICTTVNLTERDARKLCHTAKQWMEASYPTVEGDDPLDQLDHTISLFRTAKRTRESESGRQIGTPSGYDTICANSCIHIRAVPGKVRNVIVTSNSSAAQARPIFFAVIGVLQRSEGTPFAICYKCVKRGEYIRRDAAQGNLSFQLIRLTPDVRRVALYHACGEDSVNDTACNLDAGTGKIIHRKSLLNGGQFFFQTRGHGYPPRIA